MSARSLFDSHLDGFRPGLWIALLAGMLGILIPCPAVWAGEAEVLETLRPSIRKAVGEFDEIDASRKEALEKVAAFVRERAARGEAADLTFVCTHNSRRSHLAQLWAQAAACYYGVANVTAYSGGTEATACNLRTVQALRRAGFQVVRTLAAAPGAAPKVPKVPNPVYLAQFSEGPAAVKMYSKLFQSAGNPQKGFAALFCCDHAAASCPLVADAAVRVPLLYEDPKVADGSAVEAATYDERCRQIAREMLFLMARVKG